MEHELVKAVLADEALVALTGYDRAARIRTLEQAATLLGQQRCRLVWIDSHDGQPIDLRRAMDQVVGSGTGGADRVERFFDTIALPVGDEQRIVLVIDDAHLLTSDLLSYLALIGPTTVGQDLRLQIVFAGDPTLWDRLPRSGNLSAERIQSRIVVGAPMVLEPTLPKVEAEPPPLLLPIAPSTPAGDLSPPTDGLEGLRYRLEEEERRRRARQGTKSKVATKLVAGVAAIAVFAVSAVVWAKMPELGVAVRHWVAPNAAASAADPKAVAAVIARGYRLLGQGDVALAQAAFTHALTAGSAPAATGLAKTYDPRYLAETGAHASTGDAILAANLYRQAAAMGDREATERLTRLRATAAR